MKTEKRQSFSKLSIDKVAGWIKFSALFLWA